ncbi:hypothetical protein BDM02DRAFT_3025036 [Thelephora ganbajun]|uniref:Uncharacterized protein n=1 Tax=Thelephora ganbajun TaxID=370292 RepID=A0ACB6ZAB7_THEGA|nr:hypothetical protein BDM02DRAFT_3025036 [Thelephora ganbajun]
MHLIPHRIYMLRADHHFPWHPSPDLPTARNGRCDLGRDGRSHINHPINLRPPHRHAKPWSGNTRAPYLAKLSTQPPLAYPTTETLVALGRISTDRESLSLCYTQNVSCYVSNTRRKGALVGHPITPETSNSIASTCMSVRGSERAMEALAQAISLRPIISSPKMAKRVTSTVAEFTIPMPLVFLTVGYERGEITPVTSLGLSLSWLGAPTLFPHSRYRQTWILFHRGESSQLCHRDP